MLPKNLKNLLRLLSSATALLAIPPGALLACPFCNAVTRTFSEEIKDSNFAVLAKLVERPVKTAADGDQPAEREAVDSTFEIVEILKGSETLGALRRFQVLYFGQQPIGSKFLVLGVDTKDPGAKGKSATKIAWAAPAALTDRGVEYVTALPTLAEKGPERLAFFQEFLEDPEAMLATDAYDEFARAPYAEVKELGSQMHRERILAWIKDPNVSPSRRRLYLTMLGICGQDEDVPVLEQMLKSPDRQVRVALDAIIACYVILKGSDSLPLVEELFLKDEQAEYIDTYSAITALRFLGQESDVVPKARLMEGLRHILDRPKLADLVIPDLARWQDWSVMDKLAQLFKDADEQSSWVRVPVVNYLRACPKPEAKKHLEELAKIDPDAVKRANSFFPVPGGGGAKPSVVKQPDGDKPATEVKATGGKSDKATGPKADANEKPATNKKTSATEATTTEGALTAAEPVAAGASVGGEFAAAPPAGEPRATRAGPRPATARAAATAVTDEAPTAGVILAALGAGGVVFLILLAILHGSRPNATL
ncbi:MAG TPA: hypothetical protein VMV69_13425 [Pirellulales bacterium]|nr:hypothetical protein [Pirellulales bacterium]